MINQEKLTAMIENERNIRRPEMGDVIRIFQRTVDAISATDPDINIVLASSGPEGHVWSDLQMAAAGFVKTYTISGSKIAGAEGYPLLTIHSALSEEMDSHLTTSTLIMGPDETSISGALGFAIKTHTAAREGIYNDLVATDPNPKIELDGQELSVEDILGAIAPNATKKVMN